MLPNVLIVDLSRYKTQHIYPLILPCLRRQLVLKKTRTKSEEKKVVISAVPKEK